MGNANFDRLSVLQRRAYLARKSALAAPTPTIAKELPELALLYEDIAHRAEAEAERQPTPLRRVSPTDGETDLIRQPLSRSMSCSLTRRIWMTRRAPMNSNT
jgi:hypothetical protein